MRNQQIRLLRLLRSGKITEADFILLSEAMKHKKSLTYSIFDFLLNPYQYISGVYGLISGVLIIIALSAVAASISALFESPNSYFIAPIDKQHLITFILCFKINVITCLTISISLILASRVCGQKSWHILDFIIMVLLSRLPFLIVTIIIAILNLIHPGIINSTTGIIYFIASLMVVGAIFWQIVIWFYGFRDISGLEGNKLWLGFILSIAIAEGVASYFISLLIWVF